MHVSRSRLTAVAAVVLAAAGGVLAAGSFASGRAPAAAHRTAALAQRTFVSAATGNDANPCTRTAPCRNFAAAIAQTQPGGEVVVLDSGGYGTVTITQAVSLVAPPGVYAGISVFADNGITIAAGASDVVTISGLTLNGLGGRYGIDFQSGAELIVHDSVFKNFSSAGINAAPASGGKVVVTDSFFSNSANYGIFLGASSGTLQGTVEHCRFTGGSNGIEAYAGSVVVVRDSVSSDAVNGFGAANGAQLDVENSQTTQNTRGLIATFSANIRASEDTIEENANGLVVLVGGTITSFGNNRLAGNGVNGAFTATIPLS